MDARRRRAIRRARHVFWKRLDDGSRPGYAEIVEEGARVFGAGDVVTFMPDSIHSVVNTPTV